MNFLMTSYVYPLREKFLLSSKLNAYLDNPRSEEEIRAVTSYLERSLDLPASMSPPPYSEEDIVTLESIMLKFCSNLSENDSYVRELRNTYERENLYEFTAKMWIVARYDDEGEIEAARERARERRESGEIGIELYEDEHPILKNSGRLADYIQLLSLLTWEGEYHLGHSFLLDSNPSQFSNLEQPSPHVGLTLVYLAHIAMAHSSLKDEDLVHGFFPRAKVELERNAALIDEALEKYEEKMMYVAGLLRTVNEDLSDEKFELVVLVSVLELLLTHSPDNNRFNVEDSISKQFRLKVATFVYLSDRSRDLEQLKSRIKTIYNLRSSIAHGNFNEVAKYVGRLSREEGKEEYFSDLLTESYEYIRIILFEFFKDPDFVNFIKAN
ncbi:HEPN domain-containing protein [Rubrobacter aplysinae]|uniref:HEPN domain-containing protein n=1 Tax=Rubrobacter aplysinae TaxID=909625 RepID=UPI00128B593E|nr:HEPN domain-containing protein [Rubrobacter aplysinae]